MTIEELERDARAALDPATWGYLSAVAGKGRTAANERAALDAVLLRNRVLRPVPEVSTSLTLFDDQLALPVMPAPTATQRMAHADGELATLAASSACGTPAIVSCAASCTIQELESAGAPWWLQLYTMEDPGLTDAFVDRCVAAGASAVVLTADVPVVGRRAAVLPVAMQLVPSVYAELGLDPGPARTRLPMRSLDMDGFIRLRGSVRGALLVKGVQHADDAAQLAELGADGIIVSSHGARQLDGAAGAADLLPGIVDAVAGRCPVLADGGVRSGLDVLRLLVRGADAVLVGRPVSWGLATAGSAGVRALLELLREELASAMALTGCERVADIGPDVEWVPRP